MLAKVKCDMRVTTPDGRIYDLSTNKEYRFHYRNNDAVVFIDQNGLEIVYSCDEFNEDFELVKYEKK